MTNSQLPNKAKKDLIEKHCILSKKHGIEHTSHNMMKCHLDNKDCTHKKADAAAMLHKHESTHKGVSFLQIVCGECKKVV